MRSALRASLCGVPYLGHLDTEKADARATERVSGLPSEPATSQASIQTPAEVANESRTLERAYDVAFSALRAANEELGRLRASPSIILSGKGAVR